MFIVVMFAADGRYRRMYDLQTLGGKKLASLASPNPGMLEGKDTPTPVALADSDDDDDGERKPLLKGASLVWCVFIPLVVQWLAIAAPPYQALIGCFV